MTEVNEITLNYISSGVPAYGYPPQEISIKIPTTDITITEYYTAFKAFLRAVGFSEKLVLEAALKTAIEDEANDENLMKAIMSDFGIIDRETHNKIICSLQAKISRIENPDNPQYTDEEMNAMTYQNMVDSGYEMTTDGFWIKNETL